MNEYGFKNEVLRPVKLPDEKLDLRSTAILQKAIRFQVDSPEAFKDADLVISEGASLVKSIKAIHDPICEAAHKAHKTATGARKKLIDPVQKACEILDSKCKIFKLEHDRQIAEEKRAKEQAAIEENEKMIADQVKELEDAGAPEHIIKAVKDTAKTVFMPETNAPTLAEKNSRTPDWDVEIVDKAQVPEIYKEVKLGAIRTYVRQTKGQAEIPGIKVIETLKTRRKRI